jgi:hypothetical protein
MNYLEMATKFVGLIEALIKLRGTLSSGKLFVGALASTVSYENLSLDVVFDIRDRRGRKAVVRRRQRVRFRVNDTGIIRDVVWGEGDPLWRYSVTGARRLGVRQEGSRRAVLLALARKPNRGDEALVSTCRMVRNPVPGTLGYAESYLRDLRVDSHSGCSSREHDHHKKPTSWPCLPTRPRSPFPCVMAQTAVPT